MDAWGTHCVTKQRLKWEIDPGGAERDRTADLVIANDALSQLSYSPQGDADIIWDNGARNAFCFGPWRGMRIYSSRSGEGTSRRLLEGVFVRKYRWEDCAILRALHHQLCWRSPSPLPGRNGLFAEAY